MLRAETKNRFLRDRPRRRKSLRLKTKDVGLKHTIGTYPLLSRHRVERDGRAINGRDSFGQVTPREPVINLFIPGLRAKSDSLIRRRQDKVEEQLSCLRP